jgi:hypothetical protein
MIIGIALVVDELNKGPRLAFRYPESIPSSSLYSDHNYRKFHKEYLSISPDNFAKLFRPRPSFNNKILELRIDDILYIGFPCPTPHDDVAKTDGGIITMFNVVISCIRGNALRQIRSKQTEKIHPRVAIGEKEKTYRFADPIALAMGLKLSPSDLSFDTLKEVLESFSRSLLQQEQRYRYVTKQVSLMLRVQEESNTNTVVTIETDAPSVPSASSTGANKQNTVGTTPTNGVSSAISAPSSSPITTSEGGNHVGNGSLAIENGTASDTDPGRAEQVLPVLADVSSGGGDGSAAVHPSPSGHVSTSSMSIGTLSPARPQQHQGSAEAIHSSTGVNAGVGSDSGNQQVIQT